MVAHLTLLTKSSLVLVLLLSLLGGCRQSPNYNPFDDQFNISVADLINDGCDTVSAGCGYFNLQVPTGILRPYYQVYCDDFSKVVAKGFAYVEDTIAITGMVDTYESILDSLQQNHFDYERFNKEVARYNYQVLSKSENKIRIVNITKKDTIELIVDLYCIDNGPLYEWVISYWKPTK